MNTFYTEVELSKLGIKKYGKNVLLSKNAIFYNPDLLEIGDNVRIDDFAVLSGKITIGNYVHIAQFCGLYGGREGIIFEDFSSISSKTTIYATTNDYSGESMTNPMVPEIYKKTDISKKVIIKKHSVIGSMSLVLPGCIINEGCAIGAMSLVNKDLDAFGIYVGIPVKRIKNRLKKFLDFENQLVNKKNKL